MEQAVCSKCKNFGGVFMAGHKCHRKKQKDPINGTLRWEMCESINIEGVCPDFKEGEINESENLLLG